MTRGHRHEVDMTGTSPGRPTKDDLDAIRTRKPEKPMIEVQLADGSTRRLWCTFGPQQIDINPFSEPGPSHAASCSLLWKSWNPRDA